jgi:hypothetical protein
VKGEFQNALVVFVRVADPKFGVSRARPGVPWVLDAVSNRNGEYDGSFRLFDLRLQPYSIRIR